MEIRVDCYAGYRGEETPRRMTMGVRQITVLAIEDRWLAPDHRYFKFVGDDGHRYIIRHDPHSDVWQLIFIATDTTRPARVAVHSFSAQPPMC